ncbi:MAG TPA: N-acetylmuramoyl-L-alanine amidase [Deltaproteobacteria bacterium]|nr:N-acetylmuramoyl-L-alanine amidase [Deltaproteobacteria bacterium]
MDYIAERFKLSAYALLLGVFFLGAGATANASDNPALLYQSANRSYVDLCKDASRKKVRDNWMGVVDQYMAIAERYPNSGFAPESYLKGAKVYEHFSKYSGNKGDLKTASKLYQDLAGRYPESAAADDALFSAGLIEDALGNKAKAAGLFRRVAVDYPDGDMADQARSKLKESTPEEQSKEAVSGEQGKKKTPDEKPEKKVSSTALVRKLRHWSEQDGNRVVIDLTDAVSYKTFFMPQESRESRPNRLVIDLKGARMSPEFPSKSTVDEGIISGIRASQFTEDKVRVVLDLKDKPRYQTFAMTNPARIIIDVSAKDSGKAVASAQATEPAQKAQPSEKPEPAQSSDSYQSTVKKVPPGSPASKMKGDAPTIASQFCLKVSKIVIDPGHGGKDPGAISPSGIREKDITLEIGKLLARRLKEQGFEVFLTRSRDEFLTLEERTVFANKKRADLFISVHINSHQNPSVSGIETYFLNLTADSSAIEVAARENATTQKSISDLQLILNDLMLNSKINESSKFANFVHTCIVSSALGIGYSGKNLGVRQAPFYVLLGAQMPSILLELGFITNSTDTEMLKRRSYQDTLVEGIAKGINNYIMNTTYAYSWRSK